MLGDGGGYFAGSTVLVSGTAGSGKTIMAASFADATCRRGGRCLYFGFEESESQIARNMASVGMRLGRWQKAGRLRFSTARPALFGLEMHLVRMHREVETFKPDVVVIDPLTSLASAGTIGGRDGADDAHGRLPEGAAHHGDDDQPDAERQSALHLGSWRQFADRHLDRARRRDEPSASRHRVITIIKSRGMAHSDETREFRITVRRRDPARMAERMAERGVGPRSQRRVS